MKLFRSTSCVAILLCLIASRVCIAEGSFQVGTLTVQRHGDHGSPIILIPGLACGGWVWDSTVAHLEKEHALYVLTLAGFDGTKPAHGKLIEQAKDSLRELIKGQRIDKPLLIGHSLGGTLSILFAESDSDLISGVIAVEGLPVLPGTQAIPAEQRAAMFEPMRAKIAAATPAQFAAQQTSYMKTVGVLDPKRAEELAGRTARSDTAATAQYLYEDLSTDARPGLASIKVPLLEISPFNPPDAKAGLPMSEAEKTDLYRSLLQGAPHVEVSSIAPARHFVMYDQPDAFEKAVDRFIKDHPAAGK